jgi:ribose transport system ATP-binding protein
MSHPHAISVEGVTKRFGATVALDNLTLQIPQGAVHAILGENGAGKSTLIKLLSGIVSADEGAIHVMGQEVAFQSRGTPTPPA